jgi:hypothetical protein
MKLQRKVKISIYVNGKKNRNKLKGKHNHVNVNGKKREIIIAMSSIHRVKVKRMRITEKGRVYIMYGNRNRTQQVRVNRYRVYVSRNIRVYTNTASTGVQKQQYMWTPNPGCIVGEKEKSTVKISDRNVIVNNVKSVKYMYAVGVSCCEKSTLVYRYSSFICKNVVMLTEECSGSKIRYKLTIANHFPVRPKMDDQRKGEQVKEDDVEMADPALTGPNSVFIIFVSGTIFAPNLCPNLLVIVSLIMLNKVRVSCRAVISLDCFISCCTIIVINEYAFKVCLYIDRLHSVLHKSVPAKSRAYIIVELTFIIWCGRYGE